MVSGLQQPVVGNGNGSFSLATRLPAGISYQLQIAQQPAGQTCTLANASGTVTADVNNIELNCQPQNFRVGGSVSGLTAAVAVRNIATEENLTILDNGPWRFTRSLNLGQTYTVAVIDQSPGIGCSIANASGTINADVSNVNITCVSTVAAAAPPAPAIKVLFVGNSYTFGRVAPALQYSTGTVSDLTAGFNLVSPATNAWPIGNGSPGSSLCATTTSATGCFEPKPWGGVPAIFKSLADQAGLNYEVSLSTRNAATLRGHFLNTGDAQWDLRGNIASKKWDVVVLQGQSDEPLPRTKSKNGNPVSFTKYANVITEYVHTGVGGTTTEAAIFGSLSNCTARVTATVAGPGLSTGNCNTVRTIPANLFASTQTQVFLQQTWARPDMVEAHKCTQADQSTLDGSPVVDATCDGGADGSAITGANTLYYTARATTPLNLADMTADMNAIFVSITATTRTTGELRFAGVVPVGNAFQQAVNTSVVKGSSFYKPDGTFDDTGTQMNLWWKDRTHASKFGSYLSALVNFGRLTGLSPTRFNGGDRAASDLGITPVQARALQTVARDTLVAAGQALN